MFNSNWQIAQSVEQVTVNHRVVGSSPTLPAKFNNNAQKAFNENEMSRTVKGSKSCGYDYWGKRALSQCRPGRITKKITLGMERMQERQTLVNELDDIAADEQSFAHQATVLKEI